VSETEISNLARRLAEQNNVDWRSLTGSGPNGSVVERDVLDYLARVMAGEEALDPTPEPLPEGMESWTEVGVDSVGNYSRSQASTDDRGGGPAVHAGAGEGDHGAATELGEDLFLLDDADHVAAEPAADHFGTAPVQAGPAGAEAHAVDASAADAAGVEHAGAAPADHEAPDLPAAFHDHDVHSDAGALVAPDDDDLLLVSDDEAWSPPQEQEAPAEQSVDGWRSAPQADAAPSADGGVGGVVSDGGDGWSGGGLRLDDEPYAAPAAAPDLWVDAEADAADAPGAGEVEEADELWVEAPSPAFVEATPDLDHEAAPATFAEEEHAEADAVPAGGYGGAYEGTVTEAAHEPAVDDPWSVDPVGSRLAPDAADLGTAEVIELDALEETEFVADVSAVDGVDDAVTGPAAGVEDAAPAPVDEVALVDALPGEVAAVAAIAAGALPIVRAPNLLRRNVDVSALAAAQLACGLELGHAEPLPVAPFLLRAAAKAARDVGLGAGHVALAEFGDRLLFRRVDDAATRPFAAVVHELGSPGPEEDEVALVAVDLSGLELDEAFLDVAAPTVTFGRLLYDSEVGGYRSTLALTGDIPLSEGSRLLARVAELLSEPTRLLV